ncbi:immunity 52 family protein [Corallococcus exiguus]|uniref:Imm52 family immunity protein n=1 Tax=Corallococcus exiguus TaxID=83462 RepID=UPI001A8D9FBF|nr:immunity 52 family protein [Corallococcus exiguus]
MTTSSEIATRPETFYAGAYWGPRHETPEECAQRTAHLLNLLSPYDPLLASWYKPARSLRDARKHSLMPPDVATLAELFRRGVNREKGGPVFEDLGFRFLSGNGGLGTDSVHLNTVCGAYSEVNANLCLMSFPSKGAHMERLVSVPVLSGVLRSMALAFDPDWAVAGSDEYRKLMNADSTAGAFVGWVTYQSRRRGTVPPLPAPVRIEPVEDKGALIVLSPERISARNPEHVEQGHRIGELLARAGLMRPVMP